MSKDTGCVEITFLRLFYNRITHQGSAFFLFIECELSESTPRNCKLLTAQVLFSQITAQEPSFFKCFFTSGFQRVFPHMILLY